jgi:predicted DNA-binding transcriptional regulator AlpA
MTQETANATAGANTGGGNQTTREPSLLIDVLDFAAIVKCSPRHIYRLCDAGRAPKPFKIGALCRWDRAAIQRWVSDGCPSCRTGGVK